MLEWDGNGKERGKKCFREEWKVVLQFLEQGQAGKAFDSVENIIKGKHCGSKKKITMAGLVPVVCKYY